MTQQSSFQSERRNESDPADGGFRWWWAILAPYVLLPVSVGGLLALRNTGVDGPVRSLLALGLLLGAGLVHVGLYKDARDLRTTASDWMPYYRWYAVGGAAVVLGALLVVEVNVPGGIVGGVLLSVVFGITITAPVYLVRRYLIATR